MGVISRWLSNQRCFKVQYGAALVTLIVISFFGSGYKLSGPGVGDIQNVDSKDQEKYLEVIKLQTSDINYTLEDGSSSVDNASGIIPKKKLYTESIAPNIPKEIATMKKKVLIKKYGAGFPLLSNIKLSNKYWQYFNVSTGTDMYLFSAFYDHRKMFKRKAFVRVLAMVSQIDNDFDVYCKFWFRRKKNKSMSAIADMRSVIYMSTSALNTYIISCEVPFENKVDIPFAVSLLEHRSDKATNLLRIINNELENDDSKEDIAICHKGLDFPFFDNSIKLVEWIELSIILGASKIYFYEFHVHPNISKVLKYYTEKGLVEVSPLTLPGDQPNTPKELNEYLQTNFKTQLCHEKLPYNDCYFRNMNKYKYILNMDIDEVLIPQNSHTWNDLMYIINANITDMGEDLKSQYIFERFISLENMREPHGYAEDIPKFMFMLQNVYRANAFQKCPKSFYDTDIAIGTSTHTTDFCKSKCSQYNVPTDVAKIIHYRSSCKGKDSTCDPKNSVRDTAIWKYKEELITRTTDVLKILRLI